MSDYKQLCMEYLDKKGIKYMNMGENLLRVDSNESNLQISIALIFNPDGSGMVEFKSFNIINMVNKRQKAIDVCNKINSEYRWVKYYVDDDDAICCGADAYVTYDACGDICLNMLIRVATITNEVYPEFARAKFA